MRRLIFSVSVSAFFALFSLVHALGVVQVAVLNGNPYQGDTVVVIFPDRDHEVKSAIFDGQAVAFFPYKNSYRAVFGIPATKTPGRYALRIKFKDGEMFEKSIRVRAKKFAKITLGIPKRLDLTPQALVAKLETENSNLKSVLDLRTPAVFFDRPFGLPLWDNRKIGSRFGEIRKTGGTEIRHLGVDFGAKLGAPVAAINAGVVRKAYTDSVYGNSVVIDHGAGIFSLYLHLNEMKVKEGDRVEKGKVVGTVGQTGYSTSPHLHLSLKVGGVSVDPLQFVSGFK